MTSPSYRVVRLSVGKPQQMPFQNSMVETAFRKHQVKTRVYLSRLNFEGDLQADQKNHGGPDKAVLGYSEDHYTYWENRLGITLSPSAFGENLTIRGLQENTVCMGDIYELDEAVIQVSQPRKPCFKVAASLGVKTFPALLEETGYTGFYFRVLKEGWVSAVPTLALVERGRGGVSVADINHVIYRKPLDLEALERFSNLPDLAENLRTSFIKKLEQ